MMTFREEAFPNSENRSIPTREGDRELRDRRTRNGTLSERLVSVVAGTDVADRA